VTRTPPGRGAGSRRSASLTSPPPRCSSP
jgi:hypothetical protein